MLEDSPRQMYPSIVVFEVILMKGTTEEGRQQTLATEIRDFKDINLKIVYEYC